MEKYYYIIRITACAIVIIFVSYGFFALNKKQIMYCVREIPIQKEKHNKLAIGDFFILHPKILKGDEYNKQLDPVLELLKNHPEIIIELAVHTDHLGGKQYNDSLTQNQADYICDYLVSKGIQRSRIISIGKGAEYPYFVYKKISLEEAPFKGITFNEGLILNESYIDKIKDKSKKLAALYLNKRIVITIINKS